jgi:hypothetical protein
VENSSSGVVCGADLSHLAHVCWYPPTSYLFWRRKVQGLVTESMVSGIVGYAPTSYLFWRRKVQGLVTEFMVSGIVGYAPTSYLFKTVDI